MADIDIAPELLERIRKTFAKGVKNNKALRDAAGKIDIGRGSFEKAEIYAEETGKELSKAFRGTLTEETLPNGRLYYNIADRTVRPMLEEGYLSVQQVTGKLIEQINTAAGIGLKAVYPETDQERIQGIIDAASSQETAKESTKYLSEPVVNLMQHSVDEMVRRNAEFHYQAGLKPKIHREAEKGCCKWCADLAGTYGYPVSNREIYARHESCRCVVEFEPARGSGRQDVWSKKWKDDEKTAKRREYGLKDDGADGKITPKERETRAANVFERGLNLQLFGERGIKNQTVEQLKNGIKTIEKKIEEHKEYIKNPKIKVADYEKRDPRYQKGIKEWWEKEIANMEQQIKDREAEIKKRNG